MYRIIIIFLILSCSSKNPLQDSVHNYLQETDNFSDEILDEHSIEDIFEESIKEELKSDEFFTEFESIDKEQFDNMEPDNINDIDCVELNDIESDNFELCSGNNDDIIAFDEFPLFFDAPISFVVNKHGSSALFPDINGTMEDGIILWDFSNYSSEDDTTIVEMVHENKGFWFSDKFSENAVVMSLDSFSQYFGIYQLSEDDFSLMGMADKQKDGDFLKFKSPIKMLKFPCKLYDSFDTGEIEAEGIYDGQEYPADFGLMGTVHIYYRFQVSIDKKGLVKTPLSEFSSLRMYFENEIIVRNSLLLDPVNIEKYKIYLFLAECYGVVVRVKSAKNEPMKNFKYAQEYRRIGGF